MDIREDIRLITEGNHADPFSVLGIHTVTEDRKKYLEVRAFLPEARYAWILEEKKGCTHRMKKTHSSGFYIVRIPYEKGFTYRIRIRKAEGEIAEFFDPYCFGRVLTDFDLHLIGEGNHYKKYEKLGSHVMDVEGVKGVHFGVWAPGAKAVSVVGNLNRWDNRRHPMRLLGDSGIWEIFIPGVGAGEIYKFEIRSKFNKYHTVKSDPYGFYFEERPKSASIVFDINTHLWKDSAWIKARQETNWLEAPLSIYELHLGSWMRVPEEENRFLTYREMADALIPYIKKMGYTHIELMPVCEHPFDASWGYQTIGYFAPTSRFGTPEDFMFFVDQCHLNGIGVILDWAPAHFPKDGHGLGFFDGTCLYEHLDPRKGEHMDWGTLIFNYGRNEVRNFLISNALFWIEKYHIDGLRVDAVASMLYLDYSRKEGEWEPNIHGGRENLEAVDFLKKFNEVTHYYFPGVLTIAEESTSWPFVTKPVYLGGLGFDLKWNMGWMNDMLEYISKDPIYRKYDHGSLTFSLLYAFSENFVLVLSHDEVVHGKRSMIEKMPGDMWQKFATLRAFYGYMHGHPGKKLLFMSGELGQWHEWRSDQSLDWHLLEFEPHARLQNYVRDLNLLYAAEPALYELDFDCRGFEWIDFHDSDSSVISFVRRARASDDYLIVICNFTPVPRYRYRIGVPEHCIYQEIMNSDSMEYWGSGVCNSGHLHPAEFFWQGRSYSMEIVLPPLAVVYFKPVRNITHE